MTWATPLVRTEASLEQLYAYLDGGDELGDTYNTVVTVGYPDRHFYREYVVKRASTPDHAEQLTMERAQEEYPGAEFIAGPAYRVGREMQFY